jgi:MFS family permease
MTSRAASVSVPLSTMAVLMLSVFTVSIGYGIILPLLPYLIERLLGTSSDAAQISRATGLLTGLYTLSIFLFAPAWGHMSDRYGRRTILLIGLIGFSATMLTFVFVENLTAIYVERFLSGMFAAAVTPGALATIGDLAATEEARARRGAAGRRRAVTTARKFNHLTNSFRRGPVNLPVIPKARLTGRMPPYSPVAC